MDKFYLLIVIMLIVLSVLFIFLFDITVTSSIDETIPTRIKLVEATVTTVQINEGKTELKLEYEGRTLWIPDENVMEEDRVLGGAVICVLIRNETIGGEEKLDLVFSPEIYNIYREKETH